MRPLLSLIWTIGFARAQTASTDPRLQRATLTWEGSVVDAASSSSIAGAAAKVCDRSSNDCWQALTNASGRFSLVFPYRPMRDYEESVSKDGYIQPGRSPDSDARIQVGPLKLPAVLKLLALATVTGDVVDVRAQPMPNATVTFSSTRGLSRTEKVTSDASGHFKTQLVAGSYRYCATSEFEKKLFFQVLPAAINHMPVSTCSASILELKQAESIGPLRVALDDERVFSIRGSLTNLIPRKADWYEAVVAIPDRAGELDSYLGTVNARTGTISIHGLRAGGYTVVAEYIPPSHSDTERRPPFILTTQRVRVGPRMAPIRLIIKPTVTITGTVIGGDKTEGSNAIELDAGFPDNYLESVNYDEDPDGRFRVSGVPPGDYRVKLSLSHHGAYQAYITELKQDGKAIRGDRISVVSAKTELEVHVQKSNAFVELKLQGSAAESRAAFDAVAIPEDTWDQPDRWLNSFSQLYPFYPPGPVDREWRIGPLRPGTYFLFARESERGAELGSLANELRLHRAEAVRVVVGETGVQTIPITPIILQAWQIP